MKAPFTNIFLILIDTVLKDQYDCPISRKDYLTFFEMFERSISRNNSKSFNSMEINDNVEREKWGRVNYAGKRIWKFSQILKTLKDKNIVECTGYLPTEHSRRYSYTTAFYNALDFSMFDVVYEDVNEKMYNILKNSKSYDESNPQYGLLKSNKFSIDVEKCVSWLIDSFKNESISKDNCLLNIRRVHDIDNKDIYVVRGDNGRVYTSFNSLKRELRKYCYLDGKPLLSVDLKSSQPYLLASYLNNKYPNISDVQSFYNIVTDSDIYNWTMKANNSTSATKINNRDECKVEFYMYILKKTNKGHGLVQSVIESELPELYNTIKKERKAIADSGSSIANYLQSREADVFINVCERFPFECLSVHDSLYYTREVEKEVRAELENRFKSLSLTKYKII